MGQECYDALETRDPVGREAALMAALPRVIAAATEHSPAYRHLLRAVHPEDIVDRRTLSELPLIRKSELIELQRRDPPFGGFVAAPMPALRRIFMSPGPIYEPEGRRPDYWRFARALNRVDGFAAHLAIQLRDAEEKLRASFAREQEQARAMALARERTRLMRYLHDGLGGPLVSIVALAERGEGAGGIGDADPSRTAAGIVDLITGGAGNEDAVRWGEICSGSGNCIPACQHGINPRFMVQMARGFARRARDGAPPAGRAGTSAGDARW